MRFKRIKLAGFKSFVDPVAIEFPSALVGIAGPNGAGKSNIVDAVRWVMGESSARQLRGGQMADVIFNGSTGRRPAATASVEMIFDNSDGRLGSEYANWNEIAIRRTVDREGISNYYLNGTRCRRRDITDVFRGTGLGPRSYALIEQGTISRLVESKPEELREFIEEAAGVSRYKERRRETETRIRHTRENLDRLDDVLEEVGKHLGHLRRQARAAERYEMLKEEERRLRAELLALRIRAIEQELGAREKEAREQEIAVEAELAKERAVERDLATSRAEHDDALESANLVQQRFFELQTEIARLEEGLSGARRERQLRRERLESIALQLSDNEQRAAADAARSDDLLAEIETLEPRLAVLRARVHEAREMRDAREAAAAARQQTEGRHREALAEARRRFAIAETKLAAALAGEEVLRERARRLAEECERLEERTNGPVLEHERDEGANLRREAQAAEIGSDHAERLLEAARVELRKRSEDLAERRRQLASMDGRLHSLEALPQAGAGSEVVGRWLAEHDLEPTERIASATEIDAGWEWAVEVVLGERLRGASVGELSSTLIAELERLSRGDLLLAESGQPGRGPAGTLAGRVSTAVGAVLGWLADVWTAESLEAALAALDGLGPKDSVIVRDGTWIGHHWVRAARRSGQGDGALELERQRRQLAERKAQFESEAATAQARRDEAERNVQLAEARFAEARGIAHGAQEVLAAKLAAQAEAAGRARGVVERLEGLLSERAENEEELGILDRERNMLAEAVRDAERAVNELLAERETHELALAKASAAARLARDEADRLGEEQQDLALRLESLRAHANAAAEALARLNREREALALERERLGSGLEESGEPDGELQEALERRLRLHRELDSELSAARERSAVIEGRASELERARRELSARVLELREALQSLRLAGQELKTRREGVFEQLTELQQDVAPLLAAMEEPGNPAVWEQRLDDIVRQIERLGPINLAAIEECAAASQREDYLRRQRDDLADALATLEEAIRKIDGETRARFKETFEHVNERLGELFPRLFGGGKSALVLTSDDLLEAGVVVTARPPGKRNTTIQMLSGGEKALSAVALVFAIFELNPAPFCMLDEVDAPMDDTNIDRFCSLVREMSRRTQFVVITHNRRTMGMCKQLVGVTMQEPGVSRLVGVDLDEAERLAVG